jgi:KDO2-lipid IV(A) lauroyltransferase
MLKMLLSHDSAQCTGRWLGALLYLLASPQRRIVQRNLAFAFPEQTGRWVRITSRRVFRNYGTVLAEVLQLGFLSREEVLSRVAVEGAGYLHEAMALNRGVIGVSAHLGNWELGMQGMPLYFQQPLTAVAKRFKSRWLESWMNRVRSRFGNSVIYKKGALADMTQVVRRGGVLAVLVDMARSRDGIDIRFFGRKATATPAVALLALRCRSPVISAFSSRGADGRLTVRIDPPIEMRRSGDLRLDLVENTQRITDAVERAVRAHPDQWHWMMKRWKDHYPELYKK